MKRLRLPGSLRTRLLIGTLTGIGVALVPITIGYNVALRHSLLADATRLAQERAETRVAVLAVEDGNLAPGEVQRLDRTETEPIWTVAADGRLLSGPPAAGGLEARIRSTAQGRAESVNGLRLASVRLGARGDPRGAVVAAVALTPYERTWRTTLIGSILLDVVVLAAVAIAAWLALRSALGPVARMTADAAVWGERDLDRRFDLGPVRDELSGLAATLDGLLDRIAASLRRERHVTSEISHELRTPLAKVMTHAELGRNATSDRTAQEAFDGVLRSSRELARTLDALLAAGRAAGHDDVCDPTMAAQDAVAHLQADLAARGVEVTVRALGGATRAGVSREVAERALAPILANAVRYANGFVAVEVHGANGSVDLCVTDDGPGIAGAEAEWIFEPGRRGAAGGGVPAGNGLGLSLARRLARAAGGDVFASPSATGGRVTLRLPAV